MNNNSLLFAYAFDHIMSLWISGIITLHEYRDLKKRIDEKYKDLSNG